MSVRRVTTTAATETDLRDIASYIALENPSAARRFADEFWSATIRIAEMPEAGFLVSGLSQPLRAVRVSSRFRRYLIFYRTPDEAQVEIVRVLHGARDLTRLLGSEA